MPATAPAPVTADVFLNPDGLFDRFVALTADALVVANPDRNELTAWAAAGSAAIPRAVATGTVVPFASVSKLSTNHYSDVLNVHWRDASRERLTSVHFENAAARDACWASLRRRLGMAFTFSDVQFGRARALVSPAITLGVIGALTWLFHTAAAGLAAGEEPTVRGRNAMVKRMAVGAMDFLGPTGVLVVGALLTVLAVAWATARLRTPPRMLTLVRR